jgi:hypothetical protein
MMQQLTNLKAQIAEWANRGDWSDALVASFIRMAEQKFNAELRIDLMIEFVSGIIASRCAPVPDDWLQFDLVKFANINGPSGFLPIRYKSRDEFENLSDTQAYGYYTITGRTIFFGGTPDAVNGIEYRFSYYGEVPPLNDSTDSLIATKYPSLYLWASLANAALHAVGEEASAANFTQLSDGVIAKLNIQHLVAKASGSRITRTRTRSFG